MRQLLLEGTRDVEAGRDPKGVDPGAYRNVLAYDDFLPHGADWKERFAGEILAKWYACVKPRPSVA